MIQSKPSFAAGTGAAALLALFALAPAPLTAQDPAEQPAPEGRPAAAGAAPVAQAPGDAPSGSPAPGDTFFGTIDVNIVNVDVYVRDKQGKPIEGLTREDFVLREDGQAVEISNFYAVDGGRVGASAPLRAEVTAEKTEALPEDSLVPPPTLEPVYLIVYVDNFNIRPFNRNRVFRRLRDFLSRQVEDGTQIMLVSYDRSLHVRQEFTTDYRLVQNRLLELEGFTGHRVQLESERRQVVEEIIDAEQLTDAEWRVRQYAESLLNDVTFSIDAMKELVQSLAGLGGRKMIVYVSDGVPMIAGQDLYYFLQEKFTDSSTLGEMMNFDVSRQFTQLTTMANSNEVTFYTIDAAGLRVSSSIGAENASIDRTVNPGFMDSIETNNLQSPLVFMARETGGQVIMNTNDVGPGLTKVAEDFGTYYSLGYTPRRAADGRFRKIEIELREKRRGVKIRHRAGYRSKDPVTRMSDGTVATLHYGFDSNPLGVSLAFGDSRPHDDELFLLPVQVTIPIGNVVLVPRESVHEARLKLFVGAMDEAGDVSPVQQIPVVIEVPNDDVERALGLGYLYEMTVEIRGGEHRVVVGVRDEFGAVEAFVGDSLWIG